MKRGTFFWCIRAPVNDNDDVVGDDADGGDGAADVDVDHDGGSGGDHSGDGERHSQLRRRFNCPKCELPKHWCKA